MGSPYAPPNSSIGTTDLNPSDSYLAYWFLLLLIVLLGTASIIVRNGLSDNFGHYGGFGHFPIVWLGGFTVYPGYVHALFSHSGGDWVLCWIVGGFHSGYYVIANWIAFKNRRKTPFVTFMIFYFTSLIINLFNFVFLGVLHVS